MNGGTGPGIAPGLCPSAGPMPAGPAAWRAAGRYFRHGDDRLFYRREGRGESLVLLHGFPTASYDFHRVWGPLTDRYDVIAVDLLGCGFSDKPRRPYSVFEQAHLVESLLTHLGVGEAHVVAHDLGATVTQELLARRIDRPGRAEPRILSATFLNGGLFLAEQDLTVVHRLFWSPLGMIAEPFVCRSIYRLVLGGLFGPETGPNDRELDGLWRVTSANRGTCMLHEVIQYLGERRRHADRWTAAPARSPVPLALIYGPADEVSGTSIARRFAEVAPASRVVRLTGGIGHYPHLEAPDQFLRAFFAFQKSLPAPQATRAATVRESGTLPTKPRRPAP